jgi:UPF0271 protein
LPELTREIYSVPGKSDSFYTVIFLISSMIGRKRMKIKAIDLNSDMGESFGPYKLGQDEELIKLISSANVGCGFHGGDPHVMRATVTMAKDNGVGVGAHPGLPDMLGFGRRNMDVSPRELEDFFVYQIGALKAFCAAADIPLQHVKAHGVLSGMAEADLDVAAAICRAIATVDQHLIWLTYAGTKTREIAENLGLTVVEEFYVDRAYNADRTLASRKLEGAVIEDPAEIKKRMIQLFAEGTVVAVDGTVLDMNCQSLCVHGDTPGAVDFVKQVRSVLAENSVQIKPMREILGS